MEAEVKVMGWGGAKFKGENENSEKSSSKNHD
jgi:hypothetical protein